jgi:hypothetical protein
MSAPHRRDLDVMLWIRRAMQRLDFTQRRSNRGMRISFQAVLLASALVQANATPGEDAGGKLKIGNVANDLSLNGGCALQLPRQYARKEGKFVFISDFENRALVNVNGTDISVTLVTPKGGGQKHEPAIGERSTFEYAGEGIEIRIDYLVTGVCPQRSESCGVTYYDAILTIRHGKQSKSVAAKAVCGALSR